MFSPSPSFFSIFRSPKRSSSPKHTKNNIEHDDDRGTGPSIDAHEVEVVVFQDALGYHDNDNNGGRESDVQRMSECCGNDVVEVEEACRMFEKHLVEMIVEDGRTKDLMDVEELLRCWKKLKCPVFFDLVCRFYGELCKDLFSSQNIHEDKLNLE